MNKTRNNFNKTVCGWMMNDFNATDAEKIASYKRLSEHNPLLASELMAEHEQKRIRLTQRLATAKS